MHALKARPTAVPWRIALLALLALWGLFVLGFDQGQTLALAQGDTAYQMNVIHELVHDARHAAGFPCH
ncbi:MAG TPA: CbtB-domain containing protein [Chloroflexota bacterium]